ncbi:hypothetical protein ACLI1A_17885 [Flavobacterium sp. RHBU_3]
MRHFSPAFIIIFFWLITVATAAQLLFIANLAIGVRKRHTA